ncbi:alpha-N-acetylgalactosaminidase-like [Zootermopsis nevadensis]|uniref:Alpha-galactosidase n=1 Tax=Zootermopsis nevadensis TaxID=136037 RepID=A0A067RL82_ZOONE|nr:alpha-N-acetylgalactosaminidase-like [Zootermopsis nevadensis]XP_021926910.1 alpha-N-acetylgalactosaminidase-like [Zootermopsis nevadensis]KDR23773.1 Alpha-N-acetylgalactosaminidase [Zootermopsis nevadensis]
MMLRVCVIAVSILATALALDNGLALTPPMGWLAWERYRCIVDCVAYPDDCISEQLFRRTADLLVSEGYADVGYEYVIIDDCWLALERDSDGRLQPDPQRFPSGIKALADYVHSRGLKFGIYEDFGTYTCAGYPGVVGHMQTDAQTFADWEVDYVKLDGCWSKPEDMDTGYPLFGQYLNQTGRPMVYSCSWPVYQEFAGIEPDFESLKENCNLWRNYVDIDDSWEEVEIIMDYFAERQDRIADHAGPGHWNDPDMLIIGNYGLSYDQSKVQMAIWAILAAPLLISTELRDIKPEYKAILQNKDILAVNQDALGIQGHRINSSAGIEIWTRPISPLLGDKYSYAVAFVSHRIDGYPYLISVNLAEIGLTSAQGYNFQDLYDPESPPEILKPDSILSIRVNPSGVVFYRATIITAL